MVAIAPIGLITAAFATASAFGMSYMDFVELCKYSGVEQWDIIAVAVAMTSGYLILPLYLLCVNGLAKELEKFASNFNMKLKALVTPGKNNIYYLRRHLDMLIFHSLFVSNQRTSIDAAKTLALCMH